ncbi:hypothetical protein T4B_11243, partial [Trichinella pseudospiralis]
MQYAGLVLYKCEKNKSGILSNLSKIHRLWHTQNLQTLKANIAACTYDKVILQND